MARPIKKSVKKAKKLIIKKPPHKFGSSESECGTECAELEKQLRFMKMTLDALIQSDFEQLNSLREHPADKATWTQISRTINEDPKILHMLELEPRDDRLAITQFLWRFMHGGYDNYKGVDVLKPGEIRELRNGGEALGRPINPKETEVSYYGRGGSGDGKQDRSSTPTNHGNWKEMSDGRWQKLDKNGKPVMGKGNKPITISNQEYQAMMKTHSNTSTTSTSQGKWIKKINIDNTLYGLTKSDGKNCWYELDNEDKAKNNTCINWGDIHNKYKNSGGNLVNDRIPDNAYIK
jgi:hypothetical protein